MILCGQHFGISFSIPLIKSKGRSMKNLEFVGPIYETSCKFSSYKKYYKIKEEDYVAILDVGAYGSVLSSNYNTKTTSR